jgi:hypothetical protein
MKAGGLTRAWPWLDPPPARDAHSRGGHLGPALARPGGRPGHRAARPDPAAGRGDVSDLHRGCLAGGRDRPAGGAGGAVAGAGGRVRRGAGRLPRRGRGAGGRRACAGPPDRGEPGLGRLPGAAAYQAASGTARRSRIPNDLRHRPPWPKPGRSPRRMPPRARLSWRTLGLVPDRADPTHCNTGALVSEGTAFAITSPPTPSTRVALRITRRRCRARGRRRTQARRRMPARCCPAAAARCWRRGR